MPRHEVIDTLLGARARLTEDRWSQAPLQFRSICPIYAIDEAGPNEYVKDAAYGRVREAIGGALLSVWSDAQGRTLAEVQAAFDAAVSLERASGC